MRMLTESEKKTIDPYGMDKKVIATVNINGLSVNGSSINQIPYEIIVANVEFIPDTNFSDEAASNGKSMAREISLKNKMTGSIQERVCITQCLESQLFEFIGKCMNDVYMFNTLADTI